MTLKYMWLFIIVATVVATDQLSKRWVNDALNLNRDALTVDAEECAEYQRKFPNEPRRRVKTVCRSKPLVRPVIDIIPGYFEFEYAENRGAAFGTFANGAPWERFYMHAGSVAGLIAFLVLAWGFARTKLRFPALLSALCAAGAIGNIYDRITLGYVIDFILWRVDDLEWPIFNVADIAISVGFFGLLGYAFAICSRQLYRRIRS